MRLDVNKELTPVVCGRLFVKVLRNTVRRPGERCFKPHWHERMELLRIHSGSMLTRIDETQVAVEAGELAIVSPCRLHSAVAGPQGVTYDVIMFDSSDLGRETPTDFYRRYFGPIADGSVVFIEKTGLKEVVAAADEIIRSNSERDDAAPLFALSRLSRLLGLCYRHCPAVKTEHPVGRGGSFEAVLRYVEEHFTEPISTASLSRRFSYNASYFSRRFHLETGMSVTKYIRVLRLEYARRLLRQSDVSVTSAAVQSGFSDLHYFSRCFREHFGEAPGVFRSRDGLK